MNGTERSERQKKRITNHQYAQWKTKAMFRRHTTLFPFSSPLSLSRSLSLLRSSFSHFHSNHTTLPTCAQFSVLECACASFLFHVKGLLVFLLLDIHYIRVFSLLFEEARIAICLICYIGSCFPCHCCCCCKAFHLVNSL